MRSKVSVFCFCIFLWYAPVVTFAQSGLNQRISELGQQIASKLSANQKKTIAIVEFTDLQGNVTDLGRFLAEELITKLYDAAKFKVIERQLLNKIIAEQKLSLLGIVDPPSAKRLGKILGVDAIVSGSVTTLAQSVRVNVRLISTETGEIFAVASSEILKDESVIGLLARDQSLSSPTVKPIPQLSPAKLPTQRVKDFVLEVNSCKMTGDAVTCYLTIKNENPEDKELTLHTDSSNYPTRLIDDSGIEYLASTARLGSSSGDGFIRNTLISQVPTMAAVRFEKVSVRANSATLSLGISIGGKSGGMSRVTLRSILITK